MLRRAPAAASSAGEALLAPLGRVWPDAGQAEVLREAGHRPWPPPAGPWLMAQSWTGLLFAHWPVPVERLRPAVPEPIQIDSFAGSAWIGIASFEVSGLRLRGTPPAPGLSLFPELNVRTYATVGGRPGVWFLSLDAGSSLAVAAARRLYHLPYFRARMSIERSHGELDYRSERRPGAGRADFRARYRPAGPAFEARPGSLEHFLVERFCRFYVKGLMW